MTFQNLVDKRVKFEFLCLGQSEVGYVLAAILTLLGISIDNIIYELNRKQLNMGPENVKWYYRLCFIGLYSLISVIVQHVIKKNMPGEIQQARGLRYFIDIFYNPALNYIKLYRSILVN